jgi:galactosyl transferase GMA12/MNN10 family
LAWPRRVTVLTAYDQAFAAVGDISRANKECYCRRHGYTFRCRTDQFDASRPPAWSKVLFLLEELAASDWVFWSDADSLVMNSAVPVTWFLDDAYDLIISADCFNGLNTGNFFVKNSAWSRSFLETVYRQEQFIHHPFWENAAVIDLYRRSAEMQRRVLVLPNKLFNAYLTDRTYAPGDFVLHFAGLTDREVFIKNYAALAR